MNTTLIGFSSEYISQMNMIAELLEATISDLVGPPPPANLATVSAVPEYTSGALGTMEEARKIGRENIDRLQRLRDIIANEKTSGFEGAQTKIGR